MGYGQDCGYQYCPWSDNCCLGRCCGSTTHVSFKTNDYNYVKTFWVILGSIILVIVLITVACGLAWFFISRRRRTRFPGAILNDAIQTQGSVVYVAGPAAAQGYACPATMPTGMPVPTNFHESSGFKSPMRPPPYPTFQHGV